MAENIDTSSGFSRTGPDATQLGGPNLSDASFSQAGVVSREGQFAGQAASFRQAAKTAGRQQVSGAIEQGGQIVLDMDEGFAKADLEKQQRANIDAFLATREPDFAGNQKAAFQDASVDLHNLGTVQNALREDIGEGAAIEQTAPEYKAIIDNLKAAADQGVMTQAELEQRVLKTTRDAIAKRPGLVRELAAHAEQTLNLSGVRQIKDFEDDLAKMEAKRVAKAQEQTIAMAVRHNIPFDPFNPDYDFISLEGQRIATEMNAFEDAKRAAASAEALDDEDRQDFLTKKAPLALEGAARDLQDRILPLLSDTMTDSEWGNAKLQITNMAGQQKAALFQVISDNGITGTEATRLMTQGAKRIDEWVQGLQDKTSGADAAEFAQNTFSVLSNNQKSALREQVDVEKQDFINRAFSSIPGIMATKSVERQDAIYKIYNALLENGFTDGIVKASLETDEIRKGVPDFVEAINVGMRASLPRDSENPQTAARKNPQHFETMVTTAEDQFIVNSRGVSRDLRFNGLKNLVVSMGTAEAAAHLNNASSGAKNSLNNMYDQYRIVLTDDRDRKIKAAEDVGANVTTRFTPDGRVVFDVTHSNKQTQREHSSRLNNSVGNRTNELVQAYSVLFGKSRVDTLDFLRNEGGIDPNVVTEPQQSDPLVGLIKEEEGFREDAYLDSAGVPTIGYGFTQIDGKPVELGDEISRESADVEVTKQIQDHSKFNSKVEVSLTPSQKQALSSFEYNLGSGIWNTTGKGIIEAINAGDVEKAAGIMRSHNKARDPNTKQLKELRGLTKRRNREADLLVSAN